MMDVWFLKLLKAPGKLQDIQRHKSQPSLSLKQWVTLYGQPDPNRAVAINKIRFRKASTNLAECTELYNMTFLLFVIPGDLIYSILSFL